MKVNHPLITAAFYVFLSLPVFAGEISFAPYVAIPTGSFPKVAAVGDLNNDSRNDVVLGTSSYFDSLTITRYLSSCRLWTAPWVRRLSTRKVTSLP